MYSVQSPAKLDLDVSKINAPLFLTWAYRPIGEIEFIHEKKCFVVFQGTQTTWFTKMKVGLANLTSKIFCACGQNPTFFASKLFPTIVYCSFFLNSIYKFLVEKTGNSVFHRKIAAFFASSTIFNFFREMKVRYNTAWRFHVQFTSFSCKNYGVQSNCFRFKKFCVAVWKLDVFKFCFEICNIS